MKKLIVISVIFALLTGAAFAEASVSGQVIRSVTIAESNDADGALTTGGGEAKRLRAEFTGSNDSFGGWIRLDNASMEGYAWWKPIDQVKLILGEFSDGFWGMDGITRWSFYQTASDTQVVNVGNAWGGGYSNWPLTFSEVFFGGFGASGLYLEITPMDMLAINVAVPFIEYAGAETADLFQALVAQVKVSLDFGTIGFTYQGNGPDLNGNMWVYFGLSAIENLSLDVGFGMTNQYGGANVLEDIMAAGFGVKYAISDEFAIKARFAANFGYTAPWGDFEDQILTLDVLPIYKLSDNMTGFCSIGFTMTTGDAGTFDFHVNPYLQIGSEWGPSFYAGIRLWTTGDGDVMHWAIPIALTVGF